MISCMSGINSHKREIQFNLKNSPLSYNLKEKKNINFKNSEIIPKYLFQKKIIIK